jgi:hypothetical protein
VRQRLDTPNLKRTLHIRLISRSVLLACVLFARGRFELAQHLRVSPRALNSWSVRKYIPRFEADQTTGTKKIAHQKHLVHKYPSAVPKNTPGSVKTTRSHPSLSSKCTSFWQSCLAMAQHFAHSAGQFHGSFTANRRLMGIQGQSESVLTQTINFAGVGILLFCAWREELRR